MTLYPPSGMITSAKRLLGSTNSRCIGRTGVPKPRIDEEEDPVHQDHVPRLDPEGRFGAGVVREVVGRLVDREPVRQRLQVGDEQVIVEGVRVVEVDLGPVFEWQGVEVLVVGVLIEERGVDAAEGVEDGAGDRGLAGAGATDEADDEGFRCHGGI